MRKLNKGLKILFTLVVIFVLNGCDNYLNESPDDRLELDTLDKAAKVVARAYSDASYAYTDMYTDLAGPTGNAVNAMGISRNTGGNTIDDQDRQTYSWDVVEAIFQDTPTFYWDSAYEAIAHANEVLAVIDNLGGDTERRNAIKGEALVTRAYHHFMLVNLFGLHYNEMAASNLGIPYIKIPEIEFLPIYKRNTVQEVYDFVEKDLLEGLALIRDKFYIGTKKYHFTVKAAQAFASRFYLWKRDYEKCIKYSDLFLGGNPLTFVKDYNSIDASGYLAIAENYGDPADDSNVLVMSQFTFYTRRSSGFRLNNAGFNQLFTNPIGAEDIRESHGRWTFGTDASALARLREYFFREDLSSNSGQGYVISVELKGEEVLLNRAEAYLEINNTPLALENLNLLVATRYNGATYDNLDLVRNFYNQTDDKIALMNLILDERKKEFWDHGLRWFDIKRHNIPITHQLPITEGGQLLELPANDLRRAVQIPSNALDQGLIPNPR